MLLSALHIPPGYRVVITLGQPTPEEEAELTDMPLANAVRARIERDGQFVATLAMPRDTDVIEFIQEFLDRANRPRLVD